MCDSSWSGGGGGYSQQGYNFPAGSGGPGGGGAGNSASQGSTGNQELQTREVAVEQPVEEILNQVVADLEL